jgi:hypothetical protein
MHTWFWWGNLRERDNLEDLSVADIRMIFKKWDRGKNWIDLSQNRDRWWALVNAVLNLRDP